MEPFVLLGTFAVLVAIGVPIAYALGMAAIVGAIYIDLPLEAVVLKTSDGVDDFSLLAIPFFVLAGAIMAEGGLALRLVNLARVFVGFIRGGLSLVNVLASTFFGCLSGSSIADTASVGSVMIPEMQRAGYPKVFATNVTVCGSVQAILIPPSHNAVIYSFATGGTVSIAALFLGGVGPGLVLGFSLMTLCLFFAHKRGYPKGEVIPLRQALRIVADGIWALLTVVIILGGILSGVFTATESASVACLYAFFITMFVYRDYKWRELDQLLFRVVKTVGMVMILIGFASAFGFLMAMMQIPAVITNAFLTVSENKYVILLLINLMFLVLGTLMDMAPLILICTPILLPVVQAFGIDPVHFGILMMVNLGIGLITPPVGSTLFVGCAVSGLSMEEVVKGLWPFYLVMLVALALIVYVPAITLWIPQTFL